jgi:hypothetical protein
MRAFTSIVLIVAGAGGLVVAARGASSETARQTDRHPLVVLPASMNEGAGLQLASHGVAELTTDDGAAISTLHVRAVITNTTRDLPWALDASRARLELASGEVAPAFVNADVATLPIAILDPGERRTIDLYFPLPPELSDCGGPVSFALTWAINSPARVVRNAWFERAAAAARPGLGHVATGSGRHWWFDPSYPWPAYRHRPGIVTSRPPSHVTVTRAPRWDELALDVDDPDPRAIECDRW